MKRRAGPAATATLIASEIGVPAGVLTVANPKEPDKNLVELVNHQFAKNQKFKLFPCHRLDRETSGVIIFARSLEIQHRMMDMFKSHEIVKKYIACVQGHLKQKSGLPSNTPIEEFGVQRYRVRKWKEV